MERSIYLETIAPEAAVKRIVQALKTAGFGDTETIDSAKAAGRVAAASAVARFSSPTFHAAAMDGVAVRAKDTFTAREGAPLILHKGGDFVPVNTGHPLPDGFDAVVMIEDVVEVDADRIQIEAPAFPWRHVRKIGEDIVAGEQIVPKGKLLTPYDVGALLTAGVWEVDVRKIPTIRLIPTGDEVLDYTTRPEPAAGQVVESNAPMLKAMLEAQGFVVDRVAPVPDDPAQLAAAAAQALAVADVVIVCAGSSAGSKDFTKSTFERFGTVLVQGIAVMPGKPTLACVAGKKLLFGAPGYPVSAVVAVEEVLIPALSELIHRPKPHRDKAQARIARKFPSRPGIREMVRLALGEVGGGLVGLPLGRGAGLISTLTKAQALTFVPEALEGVEENATLEVELLVDPQALAETLVVVGSHDNTIDLLAETLMDGTPAYRVASAHVGSMGGLRALQSGAAHVAGCHLFDPESGDFNFPFIAKMLPDLEVKVMNLAVRHQGLIVAKGNPKNIAGVGDLARSDLSFVNRQRGAGTRILLDHHLKTAGVAPDRVRGYEREEFTHMAIAVNVLTGAADAGLGVYAAAKALDLGFIPLALERYDLVVPAAFWDDPRVLRLREIAADPLFQARMAALGGYDTPWSGRIMSPGMGLP